MSLMNGTPGIVGPQPDPMNMGQPASLVPPPQMDILALARAADQKEQLTPPASSPSSAPIEAAAPPPPPAEQAAATPPSTGNPYGDNPHAEALLAAEKAIVGPESGGKANAQNPVSSAGGLYQIVDSTWDAAIGKMGLPVASTQAERDAQKYDPALNTQVMRQINTEAAQVLDRAA